MFSKNIAITDTTDGLPNPRRIWAVIAASLALIMSVLDANIVNVVLPTLSREFGTSPSTTIWVMNAYQLAITVSLLSFSSPGDIYGYHKVFLSGVAVFCVTSLICVLSTSFWMLTVARVLQGFGASAITSVNTAQLRTIYPRKYLGRGLGISAMVVAVSAVAGPSVASIILSLGSWQWLFAINIPLGLLALIMGLIYLPHREKKQNRKFDKTSALANALTFGLLIYSMEGFAHHENAYLLAAQIFLLFIVGYYYIRRQLHQDFPLLPVDLLKIPIFSLSVCTSICSFTAPLAGYLVERIHAGILGSIGMLIFATGLFLLTVLPAIPTDGAIIWRMIVCGIGFGLFQTPNNSTIMASAPIQRSGGASGMIGTARLLGQTLGATLVALLFSFAMHDKGTTVCLWAGAIFALIAAVVSCFRLSQQMPLKHTDRE